MNFFDSVLLNYIFTELEDDFIVIAECNQSAIVERSSSFPILNINSANGVDLKIDGASPPS